ncbi:MAG TPA: AraC family transcriptional regulator [Chlamydiales bacterium]|jgi:AraC-like DNA-binding protein|nr:AraC family transcriptional regulator [Chlamydiales bacterium]
MEFRIIAPGAKEIQLANRLPSSFKGQRLPLAEHTIAKSYFGNLIFQQFKGEGFDIWYSNYSITKTTELIGRSDEPLFELHIQFLNQFHNNWDGFSKGLLRPYQYNISYAPHINNHVKFIGGHEYHTFDIHFTLAFLERFAKGSSVLNKFLEKVVRKQPTRISEIDRFLTPDMIAIVNRILQCDLNDGLNYFFIESKVKLLLTLILDEVSGTHPLAPLVLTDEDFDKLKMAHQIILADFEEDLSLTKIARLIAMNEYKMKKGFKYLFGTTIFDCRRKAIMEKAKDLLLNTNSLVEDIAYGSGFGHPSNFQKAFKRHFQFTPVEFRKFHPKKRRS